MSEEQKKVFDPALLMEGVDDADWGSAVESTAGGDFQVPEAGIALAVVSGYVDLGKHTVKSGQGKGKVRDEARLFIDLFDPSEDGTPVYNRTITEDGETFIAGTPFGSISLTRSANTKSKMTKLLGAIAKAAGVEPVNGVVFPHHLFGKPFLMEVFHNEGKDKQGNVKTYANITDANGNFNIKEPYAQDRVGRPIKDQPLTLPEDARIAHRLFLWEACNMTQWHTLFIEGTREVEEDGKKKEVSKNWMQDTIREAHNFQGSRIAALLMNNGKSTSSVTSKKAAPAPKVAAKAEDAEVEAPKSDFDAELAVANIETQLGALGGMVAAGFDVSANIKAVEALIAELEANGGDVSEFDAAVAKLKG